MQRGVEKSFCLKCVCPAVRPGAHKNWSILPHRKRWVLRKDTFHFSFMLFSCFFLASFLLQQCVRFGSVAFVLFGLFIHFLLVCLFGRRTFQGGPRFFDDFSFVDIQQSFQGNTAGAVRIKSMKHAYLFFWQHAYLHTRCPKTIDAQSIPNKLSPKAVTTLICISYFCL